MRAFVHQDEAVHEACREREVVDDGEDGGAGAGAVAQDLHDVELVVGVERGDRFVGEQDGRFDGEGAGEQDAGAFAAGEDGDGAVDEAVAVDGVEGAGDGGAIVRRRARRSGRGGDSGRA